MTRALIAALGVGLLFAGGCIQMHNATTIESDGSGTATVHISMAQEVADAVQELSDLDGDQMGQAPPSPAQITEQEVEKAADKYGVEIKRFEKITDEGQSGFVLELDFKRLSDLSHALGSLMGGGNDGLGLFRTEDGNYLLTTTELDLDEEDVEEEQEADTPTVDPQDMQKSMEVMQKLMAHMADLDISMKITVPGDVIESNAPQVEGRTSIWKIDSSNMMEQQSEMEPEIKFSGKGIDIDAPLYSG